jgi:hypothetical protein
MYAPLTGEPPTGERLLPLKKPMQKSKSDALQKALVRLITSTLLLLLASWFTQIALRQWGVHMAYSAIVWALVAAQSVCAYLLYCADKS